MIGFLGLMGSDILFIWSLGCYRCLGFLGLVYFFKGVIVLYSPEEMFLFTMKVGMGSWILFSNSDSVSLVEVSDSPLTILSILMQEMGFLLKEIGLKMGLGEMMLRFFWSR